MRIHYNDRPNLAKSSIGRLYDHQPRLRYYTYHDMDRIGAYATTFVIEAEKRKYHQRRIKQLSNKLDQLLEGED
jgi:hypothetical protein